MSQAPGASHMFNHTNPHFSSSTSTDPHSRPSQSSSSPPPPIPTVSQGRDGSSDAGQAGHRHSDPWHMGTHRSSQALILGLSISFAIVLFALLVGLSIYLYRYNRRRKMKTARASGQPYVTGDPEDKKGDFWDISNHPKSITGPNSSYSDKQSFLRIQGEGFSRDGKERQTILDRFDDTNTQWGNTISPLGQDFRGQLINTSFMLVPLRRPPSIVTFPVPDSSPLPGKRGDLNSHPGSGRHGRQLSHLVSETDSVLSYVSYKDDAAYSEAPGTKYFSMAKPSPAATRLDMYRYPTRSSTSSEPLIDGVYAGLEGGEKTQFSKNPMY